MNYLFVALCLVSVIVVINASPWNWGQCETSEDCQGNDCCVRVGGPYFKMTKCKRPKKEGKECLLQASRNGVYDFDCPCAEGLDCVAEEKEREDSGSSSSSEETKFRCRKPATSPAPGSEEEHSEGPEPEPEQKPEPNENEETANE